MNKKIVIESSCCFAKLGIEQLLGDLSVCDKSKGESTLIIPPTLETLLCITFLQNENTNDFIIKLLEAGNYGLQRNYKVIVFTDFNDKDKLHKCITSLYSSCIVVDITMDLNYLKDRVLHFLLNTKNTCHCENKTRRHMLSQREMTVLYYLLKGRCLSYVAESLGINYKTASGYKCSGMNKFGFRSLHCYLMPENRIGKFNDSSLDKWKRSFT
ncbi:response regulator transcription factor [Serratia fonticola]|uniref:LuxR C-terminal-related transcriptional regulator n=1 Tax=Serratia fonticola TaxID=47917 RepID=UPI0015C60615|nr:LuxR C-terminal-related transcriptional regulator [Serratia fonticola]MBC3378337.1 response regulator transcription factor [Serratia fonticola]NYA37537.1 response regulator transcription factor [Serratia fonticola]